MRFIDKHGRSWFWKCVIYLILAVFMVSVAYPLWYLLMYSLSNYGGLASNKDPFMFTPAGFTLTAYQKFASQSYIVSGYQVTLFRTIVGSLATVLITAITAYPLSKRDLPGRKFFIWFIMFTMFFGAGLIPTYLVVKNVGLVDSIWVLVLLPLCNTYYVLLMRTFFEDLPDALEEAAEIDGAGPVSIFFRIIFPICIPSLITIGTWAFFGHWNSWMDSMIYINSMDKQVVQVHIRRLVIEQSGMLMSGSYVSGGKANQPTEESMRAAGIMITIIPVLIVYPFVRKYFSKGMVLGAVKG